MKVKRGMAGILIVMSTIVCAQGAIWQNYVCLRGTRVSSGCQPGPVCDGGCSTVIYSRPFATCYSQPGSTCFAEEEAYDPPVMATYYNLTCQFEGGYCLCPSGEGQQPVFIGAFTDGCITPLG